MSIIAFLWISLAVSQGLFHKNGYKNALILLLSKLLNSNICFLFSWKFNCEMCTTILQ